MKNVEQSKTFPAYALLKSGLSKEVTDMLKSGQEPPAEEMGRLLTEENKKELAFFDCSSPFDKVTLTLSAGQLLFDVYHSVAVLELEQTPISLIRHNKKLAELSDIVTLPEVNLPEWAVSTVYRGMDSLDLWKKVNATTWFLSQGGKRRHFSISQVGINLFDEVLTEVADYVFNLK